MIDVDIRVNTDYSCNSIDLNDAIRELYSRVNYLEQENFRMKDYIEHIKKILPWVPDENGEFK